jgi:hypothetical protein
MRAFSSLKPVSQIKSFAKPSPSADKAEVAPVAKKTPAPKAAK